MGKRVRAKGDVKMKTFMSVPPCGLCFKAPNGYVPLAGFRSDRAEIAFSPFSGGSQPSHFESGSSLKLLYLRRNSVSLKLRYLFPPNFSKTTTTTSIRDCLFWEYKSPNMCNTQTVPHQADHWVHICNICLVSPENLSPRILVQREPRAKLLNQLIAATLIKYFHIVPSERIWKYGQKKRRMHNLKYRLTFTLMFAYQILTVCCN